MKSKIQKAIALGIALVMCATMLPTAVLAADDETADLTISTADELVAFANAVNGGNSYSGKLVVLNDDIDMSSVSNFTPIGLWNASTDRAFKGEFDGRGHTISNLTITVEDGGTNVRAGLFGWVDGNNAVVKNIVFDGATVKNASTSGGNNEIETAAGIAVATIKNGTVENIRTLANCYVEGQLRTGGVVGDIRGTNGKIINCTNEATVTGKNLYTGGIVGAAHDVGTGRTAKGAKITGCYNGIAESSNADVATVSGTTNVGGIVGYADRVTVEGCYNYAKIVGPGNYGTGGIVGCNAFNYFGLLLLAPTVSSTISSCYNYGDISGGRAGGILGAYIAAPNKDQPRNPLACVISNCVSNGNITNTTNTAAKCGAICGYPIAYKAGDASTAVSNMVVNITGCSYTCEINGTRPELPTPGPTA